MARGPIAPAAPEVLVAGWAVSGRRSAADVVLCDLSPLAKVLVKATDADAVTETLGTPFGRAARRSGRSGQPTDRVLVTGAGPGEWLVLGPPGRQRALASWLSASTAGSPGLVSVVDLTHGRALVRIRGTRARDLLAKECAIDLRDATTPDGCALRTVVAGLATDLLRDDRDGTPAYLVHCDWSSGQYLWDSLLDSGVELGVGIEGFTEPGL